MRISYPVFRRLTRDLHGSIADCDGCAFWRRYIRLCMFHQIQPEIQALLRVAS